MQRLISVCASLACLLLAAATNALPLWELEGTSNTIRLFGSVHFLRKEDYPLPQAIRRSIDDADVLVMELDMDDLNPIQAQATLTQLAVDPEGRDLEVLIGTRNFASASRQAAAIDIDLETLRGFEPWFAALQISQMRLAQLGLDPSQGVESQLTMQARAEGKPIIGLETLESQLGMMDSLPTDAQTRFLLVTLEEAAEIDDLMDDLLKAWRQGDVDTLESELLGGLKDQPELHAALLVERNRNWTGRLLDLINDDQDYLIVVGTLHLVGDDSVLAMLARRGYPSRQVKR
ncbi:MAG: TraB/GumN family protein [Gammaproteobacteria bacterium]|nr:TraB/GumN family protein [Gammaproteobacteria bacterium]